MAGNRTLTGKNLERAMLMLERVCGVLDGANIKYCLDAGTLLGIVRENRLLPWDNDMDLAISRVEFTKLEAVLGDFRRFGYKTRIGMHIKDDPPMVKKEARIVKVWVPEFPFRRAVILDIFVKTKDNGHYTWAEGTKRYARKSVPARFHDELTTVEFAGRSYSIPADADGYLTQRYGDWRTPKKEWDHILDDKSLS